jgi:hypothetical protein
VLGIPGLWSEKTAILSAIAEQTDGLKFAGKLLFDTRTNRSFVVDVYEHDPGLQKAFAVSGRGLIVETELEAIGKHTYTLYVKGPGGTINAALSMMELGVQLLKAGGLAVKVETAGLAHSAQRWQEFAARGLDGLCEAYTVLMQEQNTYYSCGMHNFGLNDVLVTDTITLQEADHLLKNFLMYTVLEQPALQNGHTFRIDALSPYYRLTHQEDIIHPSDDPFHNPFGLWHLRRIA